MFEEAKKHVLEISKGKPGVLVPAFEDERIIAGQGTIALEILEQLNDFDSVVVPVGGGGLIAGLSTVIKEQKPNVFVLGSQSEWACNARGKGDQESALKIPAATIADGIAIKRVGAITSAITGRFLFGTVVSVEALIVVCNMILLIESVFRMILNSQILGALRKWRFAFKRC